MVGAPHRQPTSASAPMKSRVSPTGSYLFRVQKKRDLSRSQLFPMKHGTAHACIEASSGSPPDAAPRRLRAPPAAPWLRTPCSRLPGRHGRLTTAAAASNAAAAAARLLLRKAAGDARTGARAAAIAHPGGQTAASAAAHAAAMEPAAPAALPAALAVATAAEAASRRLHTGYTRRAETMHERPKGGSER